MIDAVRCVGLVHELMHVTPHAHVAVSVCTALLWQLKFIRNPLAIDIIHSIGCVLFRPSTPLHLPPHLLCLACFSVVPARHSVSVTVSLPIPPLHDTLSVSPKAP